MAIVCDPEHPLALGTDDERRLMNFFLARMLSSSVSISFEVFSFCMHRVVRFERQDELVRGVYVLLPESCGNEVVPCPSRDFLSRILLTESLEPRHVPAFSGIARSFALSDTELELFGFLTLAAGYGDDLSNANSYYNPLLSEFGRIHEKRYRISFFYMPLTGCDYRGIDKGLDRLGSLGLIAPVYFR